MARSVTVNAQGIGTRLGSRALSQFEERTSESVAQSYLGTEVMSNIVFQETSYKDQEGNTQELTSDESDGYLRLDTVTFVADRMKEIKRTKIPGKDGKVNELISDGDYDISITGKLVNAESDDRPEEQIRKFVELCDAPVPIEVSCPFLNSLGIDSIVIQRRRIEEMEGFSNQVGFQITAFSNNSAEVDINDQPSFA